ncbi:hypothetical protein ETD85_52475, partial [Nonomuraea zeae]
MSSTLERQAVAVGELLVGEGPAVVIRGRVSLRRQDGQGAAYAVLQNLARRYGVRQDGTSGDEVRRGGVLQDLPLIHI